MTVTHNGSIVNWIEVTVEADGELADAVSEVFNRYAADSPGTSGAVQELTGFDSRGELSAPRTTVRTYVRSGPQAADVIHRVQEALRHLPGIYDVPEPQVREVQEEDWANAWKQHYHPLRVGEHLLIVPSWLSVTTQPGDIVIQLDPGMAFGTGTHPSTRLSLFCLERWIQPGQRVLDVGTGSGILAVAAVKLGASQVLATDIDPLAIDVAGANLENNGVAAMVTLLRASLPPTGEFDIVVANILAEAHVALLDEGLAGYLVPGGTLILGGIIDTGAGAVEAALQRHGLHVVARLGEEDWVEFVAARV